MGKTALASEAIHLWHRRFDLVLAFQAKPAPLLLEEFYLGLHTKLVQWSKRYLKRTQKTPNVAVHLPEGGPLTGAARFEQMRVNVVEAMRNENILLVIDNFETNLESVRGPQGYRCEDPEWDQLLATLAAQLSPTGSRVLITSRHRLQALADTALWVPLGPLPITEAALYLQSHDVLRALYYRDAAGQAAVMRVLQLSRGHPLILDRLASLAGDESALTDALDRLQAKEGWQNLPDIFAGVKSTAERQREREYLEEVAITAIDLLIERLSPDAQRLLRIVTLANEPVSPAVIERIWRELHPAASAASKPVTPPLLDELYAAGLVAREGAGSEDERYSFHELVRDRMTAWTARNEKAGSDLTSEKVWRVYGQTYAWVLQVARLSAKPRAMTVAAEASRMSLTYLVRARAFDVLVSSLSIITESRDPLGLRSAIAELRDVLDVIPPGRAHWLIRANYAWALSNTGATAEAIPHHERSAAEAEAAGAWSDLAWITHTWATTLRHLGRLADARMMYARSIDAKEKAGLSTISDVGSQMEAYRIDIGRGRAAEVLPEIEARIAELREAWNRYRNGGASGATSDPVDIGRALIGTLDVADDANRVLERWEVCLDLLREIEQTKRQMGQTALELASTRFNQYGPMLELDQLDEAQVLVESCLAAFRAEEVVRPQANALSALADIWSRRNDLQQAIALERQALALRNSQEDPSERAISHGNLANYLGRTEEPGLAEHRLASLIYRAVTGHYESLRRAYGNLATDIGTAAKKGVRYELPRLRDLIANPEFSALASFLKSYGGDLEELQKQIDANTEDVRRQILAAREKL